MSYSSATVESLTDGVLMNGIVQLQTFRYRIIKCIGFKSIDRAINLDATSSSRVFSKFD